MGKSGPNATLDLFFFLLSWPWVGEFVGFIIVLTCFPTQQNLENRKHPINTLSPKRGCSFHNGINSQVKLTPTQVLTVYITCKITYPQRTCFGVDFSRRRGESTRRAPRLWKNLDEIFPKAAIFGVRALLRHALKKIGSEICPRGCGVLSQVLRGSRRDVGTRL